MKDCIFCKISDGEIPCETIYENDNFFSVPDANPKVDGHSLVISKKHFKTVLDMPVSLGQELLDCIKSTTIKLLNEKKSEGFNLISNNFETAGQVIHHVHFHILPRKADDGFHLL
jgi:histidine triad (HIT) family protein